MGIWCTNILSFSWSSSFWWEYWRWNFWCNSRTALRFKYRGIKNALNECKDLISKLLERDITKRIKSKDTLEHDFFKTGIKMKKIVGRVGIIQTERVLNKWINVQKTTKKQKSRMFKKVVIAYMALNFVEKVGEKKMKNLFFKL